MPHNSVCAPDIADLNRCCATSFAHLTASDTRRWRQTAHQRLPVPRGGARSATSAVGPGVELPPPRDRAAPAAMTLLRSARRKVRAEEYELAPACARRPSSATAGRGLDVAARRRARGPSQRSASPRRDAGARGWRRARPNAASGAAAHVGETGRPPVPRPKSPRRISMPRGSPDLAHQPRAMLAQGVVHLMAQVHRTSSSFSMRAVE
jgi:hypothetical protein